MFNRLKILFLLTFISLIVWINSSVSVAAQNVPNFGVTEVTRDGKEYYKVSGVRLNDEPTRYFSFGVVGESESPDILEYILKDLIWDYHFNNQQKYKYHTGWSASISTYQEKVVPGTNSRWLRTDEAATSNGFAGTIYKYSDVDKYLKQQIGKNGYTREIHDLIIRKNPDFTVLGDSRVETIVVDRLTGGVYNPPSAKTNPKVGDTFMQYIDNDVYVDVYVEKDKLGTCEELGTCPPSETCEELGTCPPLETCKELGTCPDVEIPEGACPQPKEEPEKYDYELDLKVNRLDSRTVDINTKTKTDVYIERADFSSNRNIVKQEYNNYITEVEEMITECETVIENFEKTKLEAETSKSECSAQEVAESETPPDCSSFEETIVKLLEEIEKAQAFIPVYEELVLNTNQKLSDIQTEENRNRVVNTYVILRFNGSQVAKIDVSLSEGQTQRHTFPLWTVSKNGNDLVAQINANGSHQEFRYSDLTTRSNKVSVGYNTSLGHILHPNTASNNWKDVTQYVATYLTNSCPPIAEGQYFKTETLEGVVRAINDNGNRSLVKERLQVSFSVLPEQTIRAGSGINYRVLAVYKNDDVSNHSPNLATGTKSVESYFPNQVNYQSYERGKAKINFAANGSFVYVDEGFGVPHESFQNPVNFNETREWLLPKVAVEKFSGDVFTMNNGDHLNHPSRNSNEELITVDDKGQPLRNWYTSFLEPDGSYNFKIRTYDAGINHLNTCHIGKVEVSGSVIGDPDENHDFVKRSVDAETPFPTGEMGWNWNGKVNMLTGLTGWYKQWEITNPKQANVNTYEQSVYLTPKTIEKIKGYNSDNPNINKGDSVIEDLSLPTKKE